VRGNTSVCINKLEPPQKQAVEPPRPRTEYLKKGQIVEGILTAIDDDGATMEIGVGVEGRLDAANITWRQVKHPTDLLRVGRKETVKIIWIDQDTQEISLGLKQLRDDPLKKLAVGMRVEGHVADIDAEGATVDLGDIDGRVGAADITWGQVTNPTDLLKKGLEVSAKILKINHGDRAIALGIKQLGEDPLLRLQVGSCVKARVANIFDHEVAVNLGGVYGTLREPELSWTNKNPQPSKIVSNNQEIEVYILGIDHAKREVNLSLKRTVPSPWQQFVQKHPPGSKVSGVIKELITNGGNPGLILDLAENVIGLIKATDLNWYLPAERAMEKYRLGQEIEAQVRAVDIQNERVALGVKQLEPRSRNAAVRLQAMALVKAKDPETPPRAIPAAPAAPAQKLVVAPALPPRAIPAAPAAPVQKLVVAPALPPRAIPAAQAAPAQKLVVAPARSLTLNRPVAQGVRQSFSHGRSKVVIVERVKRSVLPRAQPNPRVLLGHSAAVNSALFDGEGSRVVTAAADHTARIWDAVTVQEIKRLQGHCAGVTSATFDPDGKWIATASADHTVRLWDAGTGGELRRFDGQLGPTVPWPARSVAFDPQGTRIVVSSGPYGAHIFDVETGEILARLGPALTTGVETRSTKFSPDGDYVLAAEDDPNFEVHKWSASLYFRGQSVSLGSFLGHKASVLDAAFDSSGQRVVTASADHTARIWDVSRRATIRTLSGHMEAVTSAAFNAGGSLIVTSSTDRTARVWSCETGLEVTRLDGHVAAVASAAFSPKEAALVVTASHDQTARIWSVAGEKQKLTEEPRAQKAEVEALPAAQSLSTKDAAGLGGTKPRLDAAKTHNIPHDCRGAG
jgi:WD40 repeat protein/predicted RNA-binding protein with RPS1 domain